MRHAHSTYMHWAKTQRPVAFPLSGSEVPHFAMERLGITLADLELDGASRYRYPPLREAIAARHDVDPSQVVMADGASMANMLAMAALIQPGDEVLAESPVYEPITAAATFLGARVTYFRRDADNGFRLDPAAIEAALTPSTRLILLTNLHNPSSARITDDDLRAIAAVAQRTGARVLVDEIFRPAAATPQASAVHLSDAFICTGSLTKVYGLSGLRCGWILAAPALAERMWRLNELFGVAQSHAAERLSTIALAHIDEISAGTLDRLARNRALLNTAFATRDDIAMAPLTDGITAFPRLLSGTPEALDALCRDRLDTSIVPGSFFGAPEHFRVGIGGQSEQIVQAIARLLAAMDALRAG